MTRAKSVRRGRPPIDADARREELLDAAERVIARGVVEPSISDIAAEAGYARTVVYAAFPNLAAVAYALTIRHSTRLISETDEMLAQPLPLAELLRGVIDIFCTFVESHPHLYPLLMQTWVSPDETKSRPLFSWIVDWVTDVVASALATVGADVSLARPWGSAFAGAVLLAAEDWNDRRDRSRAELVDALLALLMPGLAAVGADRMVGPVTARRD
ncbi:TetR/AcrR family transcriptional regulator [Smaragdicoccus niigatensis]|uniref:TetR/AcrR family transcriptional regulator n=1 Tax=Smaragdicoccus niigatensis TaxID=359359 RepID=UPI0003A29910|nr:TetR family transcriptional regulator [Smaragdicoccus niigatensis]